MKHRIVFSSLLVLAVSLALVPTALASTTWYVDGVNGSDTNDCKSATAACKTIGHAISLASSGDSIMVAAATYTDNLTIPFDLTIAGAGAGGTIVDGGAAGPVVGIGAGSSVTLSGLTMQNGSGGSGGGVYMGGRALTINKCAIRANSAVQGGGIFNGYPNPAILYLNNSTISGNTASFGGGVYWQGTAYITNSTISGNSATWTPGTNAGQGGGIYFRDGLLFINSSTISANSATNPYPDGAGIFGGATIQNSIVANNRGNGNCFKPLGLTSHGYNLSSDDTCNLSGPGDMSNTDPKLRVLGNYGGPTQTMALTAGSPAIDAGNPNGCTNSLGNLLKWDQRGTPRPDKEDSSGCDIGAYESQTD
jgi:hypothetical protein